MRCSAGGTTARSWHCVHRIAFLPSLRHLETRQSVRYRSKPERIVDLSPVPVCAPDEVAECAELRACYGLASCFVLIDVSHADSDMASAITRTVANVPASLTDGAGVVVVGADAHAERGTAQRDVIFFTVASDAQRRTLCGLANSCVFAFKGIQPDGYILDALRLGTPYCASAPTATFRVISSQVKHYSVIPRDSKMPCRGC